MIPRMKNAREGTIAPGLLTDWKDSHPKVRPAPPERLRNRENPMIPRPIAYRSYFHGGRPDFDTGCRALPFLLFLGLQLVVAVSPALARGSDPVALCEDAASEAASRTGVPLAILRAITLTETGRPRGGALAPWPWAINQAGEEHWFASRDEAMTYVSQTLEQGIRNVDLGCFQVNHRWHAKGFTSLAAMIDPLENALYAARLLKSLYARHGDWSKAAGAYHSGTPEFAARYREKFDAIFASLGNQSALPAPTYAALVPRQNSFPLLQRVARGSGGSLVPNLIVGRRLIGGEP